MRYRLLLPMFAVSVCQSVCLWRRSTRFHCAKTAEQIKIPFELNTFGGLRNIVLDEGPNPPQRARRGGGKFDAAFAKLLWPFVQPAATLWSKIMTDDVSECTLNALMQVKSETKLHDSILYTMKISGMGEKISTKFNVDKANKCRTVCTKIYLIRCRTVAVIAKCLGRRFL